MRQALAYVLNEIVRKARAQAARLARSATEIDTRVNRTRGDGRREEAMDD